MNGRKQRRSKRRWTWEKKMAILQQIAQDGFSGADWYTSAGEQRFRRKYGVRPEQVLRWRKELGYGYDAE